MLSAAPSKALNTDHPKLAQVIRLFPLYEAHCLRRPPSPTLRTPSTAISLPKFSGAVAKFWRSKMKKYLTAAVAALAVTLCASARNVDSQNDWVMLTLGWSNGTGAYTMNK